MTVPAVCAECGAALPESGTCLDLFHALLALEWQIPGGPSRRAHFLAVASYALQHPNGMGYTREALLALRTNVADVVAGRATIDDILRRTRQQVNGSQRVIRREEAALRWTVDHWAVTASDVLGGGTEEYVEWTERWAQSVTDGLRGERLTGEDGDG